MLNLSLPVLSSTCIYDTPPRIITWNNSITWRDKLIVNEREYLLTANPSFLAKLKNIFDTCLIFLFCNVSFDLHLILS